MAWDLDTHAALTSDVTEPSKLGLEKEGVQRVLRCFKFWISRVVGG